MVKRGVFLCVLCKYDESAIFLCVFYTSMVRVVFSCVYYTIMVRVVFSFVCLTQLWYLWCLLTCVLLKHVESGISYVYITEAL